MIECIQTNARTSKRIPIDEMTALLTVSASLSSPFFVRPDAGTVVVVVRSVVKHEHMPSATTIADCPNLAPPRKVWITHGVTTRTIHVAFERVAHGRQVHS
jgi:hypothetical protein